MSDLIIGVIIGIIVGYLGGALSGISVVKYQRRCEKKDKIKESLVDLLKGHKKELVDVLKEIKDTEIRCDEFNLWRSNDFKVWINGLEELEEKRKRIYKQTIQHLKTAYPDIYELWDGSIKKIYGDKINEIDGLNDELKGLRKYLSEKISDKFEAEWDTLHKTIWCVMEGTKPSTKIKDSEDMNKVLDGINIITTGKTVEVVSSDGKILGYIKCREINANGVKDFLSGLIKKDKFFREWLKSFMMWYKELNKTFDDFKNKLKGLLQDVDGDEDNLKGECDKCKLWVKEIG